MVASGSEGAARDVGGPVTTTARAGHGYGPAVRIDRTPGDPMSRETATIQIAKPADEVWALVGEFGGLDTWMSGVDACVVDGDVRTVSTMGMEITERLVGRDADARTITYSIFGEGAPVAEHEATISVVDGGDGTSTVNWDVSVSPAEATPMFRDIYQGALDALRKHLEG